MRHCFIVTFLVLFELVWKIIQISLKNGNNIIIIFSIIITLKDYEM